MTIATDQRPRATYRSRSWTPAPPAPSPCPATRRTTPSSRRGTSPSRCSPAAVLAAADRPGRRRGRAVSRPATACASRRKPPATARWPSSPRELLVTTKGLDECVVHPEGWAARRSRREVAPRSSRPPPPTGWRRCRARSPTSASSATPPAAGSGRWPAPTGWPATRCAPSRSSPATACSGGSRRPSTRSCSSRCAAARGCWASSRRSSSTWCTSRRSTAARCGSTATTPRP